MISKQMCEHIVCSAIYYDNGVECPNQPKNINTGMVMCGLRHNNCFGGFYATGIKVTNKDVVQGFLTSENMFVDRKRAYQIAYTSFQIYSKKTKTLMSEDLF